MLGIGWSASHLWAVFCADSHRKQARFLTRLDFGSAFFVRRMVYFAAIFVLFDLIQFHPLLLLIQNQFTMKKGLLFLTFTAFSSMLFAQTMVSTLVDDPNYRFTDDLIFDASGNLFCADYSGDAIYKRTPSGLLSVFASGFNTPNGLAFDSAGNLFVCDNVGNAIYKLNSSGVFIDTIAVGYPSGIVKMQNSDTMIFTTYGSISELKKLAPDGSILPYHMGAPLNGPVGLEYCQGILYLSNFTDRKIFRVEDDTLVYITQVPGTTSSNVGFIASIGDKLLATNFNTHKIYIVDPVLETSTFYAGIGGGYTDGPLDTARFLSPNGIIANVAGDSIFVSEYNSKKLRLITGFTLDVPSEQASFETSVYPNPALNSVRIEVPAMSLPVTVQIFTADGREVSQPEIKVTTQFDLNISSLDVGIFYIKLQSVDGQRSLKKVTKVH